MEFIKPGSNYNFIGIRWYMMALSIAVILAGLLSIYMRGLNYGIDFAGGTLVQIRFDKKVHIDELRRLVSSRFKGSDVSVQDFGERGSKGKEFIIRIEKSSVSPEKVAKTLKEFLESKFPENRVRVRRVEVVGPKAGSELRRKGLLAIFYSIIGLLIYITWRFEFRFAVGAIIALVHDVLVTVGIFSLLNKEFNLPILAAVLTILGYSLNDTIVVFDRIRENMRRLKKVGFEELVNRSINETLSRTILTSLTTMIVVVVLFIFGGGVIRDFAFALIVGIVSGTYSSIYIASPVVIDLGRLMGRGKKRSSR